MNITLYYLIKLTSFSATTEQHIFQVLFDIIQNDPSLSSVVSLYGLYDSGVSVHKSRGRLIVLLLMSDITKQSKY